MTERSEKEELQDLISRAKAGIAQHLIEKGVKADAAVRAVENQVRFGRMADGRLLMRRGTWMASPVGYQRECAQHILPSLAPEDMKDSGNEDEDMWTIAERRLSEASATKSRAELLEERREEEVEKARQATGSADEPTLSMDELVERKRASGVYGG